MWARGSDGAGRNESRWMSANSCSGGLVLVMVRVDTPQLSMVSLHSAELSRSDPLCRLPFTQPVADKPNNSAH